MANLDEDPKKQQKDLFYKQQQQRLQNIAIIDGTKKDVSADDLIRNILEKVNSDAKISKLNVASLRNTQTVFQSTRPSEHSASTDSQSVNGLPIPRCFLSSPDLPSIYLYVWNVVKQSDTSDLCDRDKLYQVLLLSKLPSNVLAQLWTFVNRTIPGQVTKNELFVLLALIGLIQSNYPDPLNEIYKISFIPLPSFVKLAHLENNSCAIETSTPVVSTLPSPHKMVRSNVFESFDDHEDDFADFKSADTFDIVESLHKSTIIDEHELPIHESVDALSTQIVLNNEIDKEYSIDKFSQDTVFCDNLLNTNVARVDIVNNSATETQTPQLLNTQSDSIALDQLNDKYSSLRRLTTKIDHSEEFGDFFSHSTLPSDCDISTEDDLEVHSKLKETPEVSAQTISNKRKILSACKQVMQKTFNILIVNHGEESTMEALNSKDGASFVLDLNEVFMMSQRINANLNILNNSFEADQCDSLFKEIEKKWNLIYNTIRKSSINLEVGKSDHLAQSTAVDLNEGKQQHCSICSDQCHQSSSLLFAGFRYHISCANFWLNFVDSSLPHRHYEEF